MKKYFILCLFFFSAMMLNAQNLNLWGIDITKTHPEITWCRVEKLEDDKIFSQLKFCSDGYTFANDRPVYTCFYGDELSCFAKATEIITAKFGNPLEIYADNKNNPYTIKAPFINIWKYNKDDRHFVLLLFGSGEGMTLDVIHFVTEKKLRTYIISTIKSFNYTVKPLLYDYLDK